MLTTTYSKIVIFLMLASGPCILAEDRDTVVVEEYDTPLLDLGVSSVVAQGVRRPLSEEMRSVSVIQGKDLRQQHNQSLSDAIRNQPGVELLTQGPNIAKPSIRGMTNQRVVLVRDGIRHEAQQWSNHHTFEVDVSEAQQIEVLRGPAGILYGSGAVGGVVLVRSPDVETLQQGALPWGGCADYQIFSNSAQQAGHLCARAATERFQFRADGAMRSAPYYSVPGQSYFLVKQAAGAVSDTAKTELASFENYNMRLLAGYRHRDLQASLTGTQYWERQTLIGEGHWHNSGGPDGGPWYHVGEPIESPTLHQKIQLFMEQGPISRASALSIAYQHDHRRGIPGSVGTQVDLENHMVSATLRHPLEIGRSHRHLLGGAASYKVDRTHGVEVLIPNHSTTDGALFMTHHYDWNSDLSLAMGLRGDFRQYNIESTRMTAGFQPVEPVSLRGQKMDSIPAMHVEGVAKAFVPSFSTGLIWRTAIPELTLAMNMSSGFRLPDPNELAILGAHHGSYEYMVGLAITNPNQSHIEVNEISKYRELALNSEMIVRWNSSKTQSEWSLYYNRLFDYIYAQPTGQYVWLNSLSALPVKEYIQTDAAIYGLEYTFRTQFHSKWALSGLVNYTIGRILDPVLDADRDGHVESWLPGIAPPHIGSEIEHQLPWNLLLSTRADFYFPQNRLAEFENVLRVNSDGTTTTFSSTGYGLWSASIRWETWYHGKRLYSSLQGTNLMNKSYTSHLSSYKGIAKDPGFGISAKIGFDI